MAASAARSKILPLPSAVARCDAGVEDLLEDARDREDEGGLEGRQLGEQVLDVGAVPEPRACLDAADLDDPREHVGERQEQQGGGALGLEEPFELGDRDAQLVLEVVVGEHAALGPPGRAGGVDQRREVVRARRRTAFLELRVADAGAEPPDLGDRPTLERPDVGELGQAPAHGPDAGQVGRVLHHDRPRPGVREDPLDLLLRRRLVDRHGRRAGEPDRVVEQGPLVARARDQGHPVAGLDAGRDQALRHGRHLVEEGRTGDVRPSSVGVGTAELHRVRRLCCIADDVVGEVARRGHGDGLRGGVLAHDRRLPPAVPASSASRRARRVASRQSGSLPAWPNRRLRRSLSTPPPRT